MTLTVGILTGGSSNHQTTSEEANAVATDFFSNGATGPLTNTTGVAPATGSFAVNAQGSPNMTVAVSSGIAYVAGTPTSQNSQKVRVKNSASVNGTIAANASGSTKYDWVYISLDATKLANPAVGADDVATIVISRSSNATTDDGTPPTYGYALAVVTVANGASSITNGNITDRRVPATYRSSPATNGVNHVDVASSTTGNDPTVSAVGTDANINLALVAKGTGVIKQSGIQVQAVAANTNATKVFEQSGWTYVNPASGSATTKVITFPVTFPTAVLTLEHGIVGARTSGAPAAITDFNVGISGETLQTSVSTAVSTSGVTIQVYKSTNFSSAGTYYGVWWRVKGN